ETTPGGRALRFYASVRAEVKKKPIKKSDVFIGNEMTLKIVKNKVARPFTETTVDYYYDTLFDIQKDILNVALDMDIIHKRGAYYFLGPDPMDAKSAYKDKNGNDLKWQGKETVERVLKENPDLFDYINDMVQGRLPK